MRNTAEAMKDEYCTANGLSSIMEQIVGVGTDSTVWMDVNTVDMVINSLSSLA